MRAGYDRAQDIYMRSRQESSGQLRSEYDALGAQHEAGQISDEQHSQGIQAAYEAHRARLQEHQGAFSQTVSTLQQHHIRGVLESGGAHTTEPEIYGR